MLKAVIANQLNISTATIDRYRQLGLLGEAHFQKDYLSPKEITRLKIIVGGLAHGFTLGEMRIILSHFSPNGSNGDNGAQYRS